MGPYYEPDRRACLSIQKGFKFRLPPDPHKLSSFITPDSDLFQTVHMGAAVIDPELWQVRIHGLVEEPYTLNLAQLKALPSTRVTSFHECFGSPLKPPVEAVRRVGNVVWTGVPLRTILEKAKPLPEANFVWSDGLDHGPFGQVDPDRYQKDLPLQKALKLEVLLAYEINGQSLDLMRGGPVRLVVPGWFGTNSTKWLFSLSLQKSRSPGPFTTTYYNEPLANGTTKPVWEVEPNSIIVSPEPGEEIDARDVRVWGWAWSCDGIEKVEVSQDGGKSWRRATLKDRTEFEWQMFELVLCLDSGPREVTARATTVNGYCQPMSGRRNHVHTVQFDVA